MAHSQPVNSQPTASAPADGSTNVEQALSAALAALGGDVKVSGAHKVARTNDTATIYSAWLVPPLKTLLLSLEPTLKISEQTNGDSTSIVCAWPDVSVRFTVQTRWDGSQQRQAMNNWIVAVPGADTNAPAVKSLIHQVDGTVACIGSVITPRYDSAGKASALVRGVAAKLDGYVFSQNSFYTPTGEKIIGATNAPAKL